VNAQKGFPGKEIDTEKEKNLSTYLWDICRMAVLLYCQTFLSNVQNRIMQGIRRSVTGDMLLVGAMSVTFRTMYSAQIAEGEVWSSDI
jgi:hypothetical protein